MERPIQTLKQIKQINFDYYAAAHMAKQNGQFVAYVNTFTPVELLYALDIFPIYPENHAAIVGARKMTTEVSPSGRKHGVFHRPVFLCQVRYRVHQVGHQPHVGVARAEPAHPTNSQCGTLTKWFEAFEPPLSRAHGAAGRSPFRQREKGRGG